MFTAEELKKYANTLWWGLTTARPMPFVQNDRVLLRFDLEALPLVEALYPMLLDKGLLPVVHMNFTPSLEKTFYDLGSENQVTDVPPGSREFTYELNGLISILAPTSLTHLANVDPKKIAATTIARKSLRNIMEQREQCALFSWTLCVWPTKAMAEASRQNLKDYTARIRTACFLDHPDPTTRWAEILGQAQDVKFWLNSLPIVSLRLESTSTDLTVTLGAKRRWLGVSGHNIPSFEIFISPDWRGTRGVYFANQPSYHSGNFVRGIRIEFQKGLVIKVNAEENEEFVKRQLSMDSGARRLGEFSLTDRRHSRIDAFMANTLFDENFGGPNGNCHVAMGASYLETYTGDHTTLNEEGKKRLGFNDSALHWDLVNTEKKTVTATLTNGTKLLLYDNGEFRH